MAEEADEIIGFNRADAEALLSGIGGTGAMGGHGISSGDATSLRLGVATTGVPARSGTTLGKATDIAVKYLAESGTNKIITDAGFTVTAYNLSTTSVGTGNYILMTRLGSAWIVTWEDC